ncbi:two-component sensor histidine kinase [Ktedonospora formicarum]|uniref:histidine kinase n=1 Tax=Ktedonospora formicarum TaxID=2778364 RepID=A0A8J3MQZ2_9CHLR|nr:histidine kinase dimerization/phospho-acceptor domain-containing protein [Ktedonospora formicarum]GHO45387.1 two-component sensor histidine kinase [Ktedonospora formicarum]
MKAHWHQFYPPGVRFQLTLWYIGVSALLVSLCAFVFYMIFEYHLATNFDTELHLRTQQIANVLTVSHGQLNTTDIVYELSQLDVNAAYVNDQLGQDKLSVKPNKNDQPRDLFVRVLDTNTRIIYASSNFHQLSLDRASAQDPLHGNPWHGTVDDDYNQSVRVYSTMLVWNKHIVGIIQIGQSLETLNAQLRSVLTTLILLCLILLVFSGLVSYWLSARAFKPIHHLARTARAINARDLHKRVPLPKARDEVYDLTMIFNQMIGRLEEAFAQQRRFVADASHELRTPVTVIRNMTEVALSRSERPEEYAPVLEAVNEEVERLGRLINDLLALARVDEQKIQLDYEPVRLDFLATDVIESMEALAQENDIVLRSGTLQPASVLGDAARLIQIIMSLVDNALKYTNAGDVSPFRWRPARVMCISVCKIPALASRRKTESISLSASTAPIPRAPKPWVGMDWGFQLLTGWCDCKKGWSRWKANQVRDRPSWLLCLCVKVKRRCKFICS